MMFFSSLHHGTIFIEYFVFWLRTNIILLYYFVLVNIFFGCGGRIWTYDLRVMSPTSYQTAPPRDNSNYKAICHALFLANDCPFLCKLILEAKSVGTTRSISMMQRSLLHPAIIEDYSNIIFHKTYFLKKMAEEEGFEPPRALIPLSVFKTDPFSRTWVFLHI